jgi:unsaturated rhamnogalacturonyl hydrolase
VLTIDFLYEEGAKGAFPPVVRHVQLDHISSAASPRVLFIRGFKGATIAEIRLADSTFRGLTLPDVVEHAAPITFERVVREPKQP